MRDDVPIIAILCKAWSHGLMREWFHHTNTMQFGDKWSQYAVILSWLGVIFESLFTCLVFFRTYYLYQLWFHVFCKASMLTMLEHITDSPSDNPSLWCAYIDPQKSKFIWPIFLSMCIYPPHKNRNYQQYVWCYWNVYQSRGCDRNSTHYGAHEYMSAFRCSRISLWLSAIVFLFLKVKPNTLQGKRSWLPKSL